jgi:osmotically-inducible protein OsmY
MHSRLGNITLVGLGIINIEDVYMNIKQVGLFAVLVSSLAVSNVVFAVSAEDAKISTKVAALINKEKDLPVEDVKISTEDRIVKLKGQFETALQANRAIILAYSVSNVRDVDSSELDVKSSSDVVNDATITARAKGKVLQLAGSGAISLNNDLSFETTDGNLHILGRVATKRDIETITNALKDVRGVKHVRTNIKVTS